MNPPGYLARLERDLSAGPPSDPLGSLVPDIKNTPPVDSRALGYRIAALKFSKEHSLKIAISICEEGREREEEGKGRRGQPVLTTGGTESAPFSSDLRE